MTNFLEEQDFLGNYIELLVDRLHQSVSEGNFDEAQVLADEIKKIQATNK
tara:strand:- start:2798 stop:2947 length:150 start_codon:yes stop_codon:yes gene_type:complete